MCIRDRVSLALIASVCIGEDFAAGEVAFIMQLGGLLEDLTVAKARAGIEKDVYKRQLLRSPALMTESFFPPEPAVPSLSQIQLVQTGRPEEM